MLSNLGGHYFHLIFIIWITIRILNNWELAFKRLTIFNDFVLILSGLIFIINLNWLIVLLVTVLIVIEWGIFLIDQSFIWVVFSNVVWLVFIMLCVRVHSLVIVRIGLPFGSLVVQIVNIKALSVSKNIGWSVHF